MGNITIIDVLPMIFAFVAVILAWLVPQKIMINQIYADLLKEYRSPEFGEAITALIDFYIDDCGRDVSRITDEYIKRHNNEKKDIKNSLHFKRRLLWQFYWDLSRLRYEYTFPCTLKHRLKKNFTERESEVMRLLYHTIDGARRQECSIDISDVAEPKQRDGKTERLVYRLYQESKRWK